MTILRWSTRTANEIADGIHNSFHAVADLPLILLAIWTVAAGSFIAAVITHH